MGQLGRWHIVICSALFFVKFPVAMHNMAIIFLSPPPSFRCVSPPGISDGCSADCKQVEYNRTVFTETIITQWDLICDKSQLANLSQTIFMLGVLIGNFGFGVWSDKKGRRPPFLAAIVLQLVAGTLAAFAPWFWLFCILRFITAAATGGTMCTGLVIVMEIIGKKWRELFSVLYQVPFFLGHLCLPLAAYFFRDWHHFQLAISLPVVLLLSYYWLVPESPRWLFTVGKLDEASKILQKAAERNNLPTENIRSDLEKTFKEKDSKDETSKGNVVDLFRTPNMRQKSLILIVTWFICGLTYFGVAQYVGHVEGDIFLNVAVSALLELPGTVICIVMMKYFGRRVSVMISCALTGVGMLCIAFISRDMQSPIVALASIALVSMSIAYQTFYLYGCELFPTVVRNVGVGICSMSARAGSTVAPFIVGFGTRNYLVPPIIFGVLPLTGALLTFFLPETKGFVLPETIADGEKFGKKEGKVKT
ncbi:unnamed protein product [Hermetia illucens]|uniref:Major facilitator superfamily (MFS) profile domain-containing protein n=2 Tax=Hermetia illucens TaxID=343691 RepID=A0A7R8Z3L7_HERIL|nr:unnamed protein product [Hermetia illucens]